MDHIKIKRLSMSAMFCALIFVFTLISIPVPSFGNINLGDSMVILCSLFGGYYGILSASIGSSLCDILNGYMIYAPATFIIKALMVFVIVSFIKRFKYKKISLIISIILSEFIMILGYFLYEFFVLSYGYGSISNILFNLIQAIICSIIAFFIYVFINKIVTSRKKTL